MLSPRLKDVFTPCLERQRGSNLWYVHSHVVIRYVSSKNQKVFMADLKPVYHATSKEAAEVALDHLEERWGEQYPIVIKSWRRKWKHLFGLF